MYAGIEEYYNDPMPWPWIPQRIPFKTSESSDDFIAGYCLARTHGIEKE